MNENKWLDLKSTQKGAIGENIIKKYLVEKNLVVYTPTSNGAHGFDMLYTLNKENLTIVEVKTYPKRQFYPDTGINYNHYEEYKAKSKKHNIPIKLFFVDEEMGQIYGEYLHVLDTPNSYICPDGYPFKGKCLTYPMVQESKSGKKIYFYQPTMEVIGTLSSPEICSIKILNSRNYKYKTQQQQTLF